VLPLKCGRLFHQPLVLCLQIVCHRHPRARKVWHDRTKSTPQARAAS
jgi:hypothetical protein